ncbi:hypothetical protein [Xanthomonas arboricola]|uniref:hypothetical protein n=1 Tax=Xanthomonas arboricola TaxID=56448 RepID=UPI000CEEB334|nr:hypothetical protein [Xanthomonas arboricola]MBB6573523.1 hypothetical protein [Xanthomonas arboricola]PPT88896.1 hypothetical protein XarbCFBP8149_07310 [Xanthomonas arboricola]
MPFHLYCAYVEDGYEVGHYFIADSDTPQARLQLLAEIMVSHEDTPTEFSDQGPVTQDMLNLVHARIQTGPFRLTPTGQIESNFSGLWEPVSDDEFSSFYRNAHS